MSKKAKAKAAAEKEASDMAALEQALVSDDVPEGIQPMLWLAIKHITKNTTNTTERLDELKMKTKALEESCTNRDDDIEDLQESVKVLQAQFTRNSTLQGQLVNAIEDIKSRSMKDNIIINFDHTVSDYHEAKGKLQTQFTKSALPESNTPPSKLKLDVKVSRDIKDGGSMFRGYFAEATNMHDVSNIKQFLICKPEVASASHLILAYRMERKGGKIVENFDSDRDWGTGFRLLKMMRENDIIGVCFATRLCSPGYVHIGHNRFEHIHSYLTYVILLWGSTYQTYIQKLEVIQKKINTFHI